MSCSKKNDGNPSPSTNSNTSTNQSGITVGGGRYGLYYTFKGKTYLKDTCGYSAGGGSFGGSCSSFSNLYSYEYSYGKGKSPCSPPNNFFSQEDYRFNMFRDSTQLMKIMGKKVKQFNGYFNGGNGGHMGCSDTLVLNFTFSNPSIKYISFDQNVKDTISNNGKHYFRINNAKFKNHTYSSVTLLLSGDFNQLMVNNDNSADTTTVTGYFNDLEWIFNRK